MDDLKAPPYSLEAERSVLGSLMIDNETYDSIIDVVREDDFYRADHRLIFRAIAKLSSDNQPFDVITVSEFLESHKKLNDVGGMGYLGSLVNDTPTAANITPYAKIVSDKSILRSLIRASNEIAQDAYNPDGRDSVELLGIAENKILALDKGQTNSVQTASALLPTFVNNLDDRFTKGVMPGLSTGFKDLDDITLGFGSSNLVIIAGRPGMGKSVLGMNIARYTALEGKNALLFSLEMEAEELMQREIAALSGISLTSIRTGDIKDHEWPKMTGAIEKMNTDNLLIDDSPSITVAQIAARSRRIMKRQGLDIIIVDYLQLVTGEGDSQTHQIELISKGLKRLAKELKIPVVALSQLNRELEKRPNKRPIMSDLRQSGAIEQDADIILFVYRDEYYNEDSADKGLAELIIAKQRNGPTGMIKLVFEGQFCRFKDYAGYQR